MSARSSFLTSDFEDFHCICRRMDFAAARGPRAEEQDGGGAQMPNGLLKATWEATEADRAGNETSW